MKILYVDYFQKNGHVNFNRIHIDALRAAGHDVTLIMHREIARRMPYPDSDYALLIPRILRFRGGSPWVNRIVFLITLLLIRLSVRVSRYDAVFLGCVDELTYSLLPIRRDAYIFAHGNARFLPFADGTPSAAPSKYRALKHLGRHATYVVFNDYMADAFRHAGMERVKIVSHGCVAPFPAPGADALVQCPIPFARYDKIIFHPSEKCHAGFLQHVLNSEAVNAYLREHNVLLILRNRPAGIADNPHIQFLNGFLETDLYRALFHRADVILMCYPPSFHHQVSGVSFECVANAKAVLALHTPSLEYIRPYFNYDPLFARPEDFIEAMDRVFSPVDDSARCIVSPELLRPDYSHFFD